MRVKEKKAMLEKLTGAVGALLVRARAEWTDREIAEAISVPASRLTEYKNFEKYQRPITLNIFTKLLGEGLFTVEDVIAEAKGLTEKERQYLRDMGFYENDAFRSLVIKNKQNGVDPVEVQSLISRLTERGIDPIEALRKLDKDA